ncbi:MAG TPA: hypothetical protein DEG17_04110 [Cyanobacteria bacterium UBA11149]|nr:hypothetical protein [Cyanobacteria bacterium UBA11367]HBE59556.1 hypothetical protein [Cyanobacteria bacterium UBA11366]HBK65365.1 hypothetical protein [Cyanobacteria bacterium UBA11166]HBR75052.1 hypothetical protein [Cyanobacteria bacterium UBA11159]HBS68052.1 hypothetical protein [Cyanobacteria bacterium UBA11153]HBW88075.1 hypothetical protein [Cyanobacteria bacterium UBA11149]HCA95272.1 hypothetical protein [Cyanobacteria bacterium UBA9226]
MLASRLDKLLIAPQSNKFNPQVIFWLSLSLTFAIYYGWLALQQAFEYQYVIQDDARQHVFWMERFIDKDVFPHDLIADYFQSIAPPGYGAIYQLMASLKIHPIFLSKILPPILGVIATVYCFGCVIQIFPVPVAGFIATLLLNQNLWMKDDLASGTPRAFLYPLFLAFLYYLIQDSWLPVCALILLQGMFYPQFVFICAGILILRLLNWQNRCDWRLSAVGLGVAGLVILPYAWQQSKFGPVISASQARLMPDFSLDGRARFFVDNSWQFWFHGQRTGILPLEWGDLPYNYFPLILGIGLSLILLIRYRLWFPLVEQIKPQIRVLPELGLASLGMFFLAHALLFKLHLPSRYTQHSLRILMAISAAISLTIILDAILNLGRKSGKPYRKIRQILGLATTVLFATILVSYPNSLEKFPSVSYKIGKSTALYQFFQEQPKDILIASLAEEAGNLPSFAKRSILTARQYAIPYHLGYYNQIRQRSIDLINAQYSPDFQEVKNFIHKYKIDFWLLDKTAFTPDYLTEDRKNSNRVWIRQHQTPANDALQQLQNGTIPALLAFTKTCAVFDTHHFTVIQADCIIRKT